MKNFIFMGPLKDKIKFNPQKIKKKLPMIFFCCLLVFGIVFGSLNVKDADRNLLNQLDFIFLTNYDIRCSKGIFSSFIASFASSSIFLFVIFLFGLSLWGGIFAAVIPFLKGYGYGLAAGFLYHSYGVSGILYNILIILPGTLFCSVIISSAAQQSVINSVKMCSYFLKSAVKDDPQLQMKKYVISMLWYLGLCALSALLDMLCSLGFSWIFRF